MYFHSNTTLFFFLFLNICYGWRLMEPIVTRSIQILTVGLATEYESYYTARARAAHMLLGVCCFAAATAALLCLCSHVLCDISIAVCARTTAVCPYQYIVCLDATTCLCVLAVFAVHKTANDPAVR